MTVTIDIFKPPQTDAEAGSILAAHMPQGRAWDKKNDPESNMNGLVRGLAADFMQVQQKIYEMAQEFNINLTTDLLPDWETSVGIPDDCVFTFNTLAERRQRVIERLSNVPVVTLAELQTYIQAFFASHTVVLSIGTTDNKFVIIATIETGGNLEILECLLRNIVPGNVLLVVTAGFFGFSADTSALGFGTLSDNTIGGNFVTL